MASIVHTGFFMCSRCLRQSSIRTSRVSLRPARQLSYRASPAASSVFAAYTSPRRQQNGYSTLPTTHSSTPSPPPPPKATAPTSSNGSTIALLNPRTSEADDSLALHVDISPRAAHRLTQIMNKESDPAAMLRVTVESGGCHGFQYLMNLTDTSKLDRHEDTLFVFQKDGVQSNVDDLGRGLPKVAMDKPTLELLEGSKVDYTMELIGSQFKIVDNPRATSSCGCGTSFDVQSVGQGPSGW
jgi:iron-sulfur cluster assembly 2